MRTSTPNPISSPLSKTGTGKTHGQMDNERPDVECKAARATQVAMKRPPTAKTVTPLAVTLATMLAMAGSTSPSILLKRAEPPTQPPSASRQSLGHRHEP